MFRLSFGASLTLSYSPSRFGGFRPVCCRLIYESHASNPVAPRGTANDMCFSTLGISYPLCTIVLLSLASSRVFPSRFSLLAQILSLLFYGHRLEDRKQRRAPERRLLILISIDTSRYGKIIYLRCRCNFVRMCARDRMQFGLLGAGFRFVLLSGISLRFNVE